jgi:DNA processing protein
MIDINYLVALYSFTYFGPARTKLLLKYFGNAKKAWQATLNDYLEIGLKERLAKEFVKYRDTFDIEKYFKKLEALSINFVTYKDSNYPENLRGLDDAPLVLYYLGTLRVGDVNAVAIVGSRKMTSYGREVAYKFASELASLGITIVSGLALGIDAVAHKATVDVGGRGIAVMASGLDIITPMTNRNLAFVIVKKGGNLMSEYPLGFPPYKTNFASRNRIVSGLSKAIIVVEGLKKSGTLLTASSAAEQGRAVFAVPGQITSPMAQAPLFLLKNGARLATSVADILEELDMQLHVDKEVVESVMPADKDEGKLIEVLGREPLHLDELARITNLKASEVSGKLIVMELKGMVKNIGNGVYKKV